MVVEQHRAFSADEKALLSVQQEVIAKVFRDESGTEK